ncbi:hypothetical protein DDT91_17885 [Algoriphagus sp. AK58]|nr:hypothetical protein [Algoriphagus sp. AK58]
MFPILVNKFSIGDSPATSSKSRVLQYQVLLLLLYFFDSSIGICLSELKPAVYNLQREPRFPIIH